MSHQSHANRAATIPTCEWCNEPLDTEPDKRRQYHRLCFVEYTQVQQGREIEALGRVAGKLAVALERVAKNTGNSAVAARLRADGVAEGEGI